MKPGTQDRAVEVFQSALAAAFGFRLIGNDLDVFAVGFVGC